jgi:uncharacterized membrane protein
MKQKFKKILIFGWIPKRIEILADGIFACHDSFCFSLKVPNIPYPATDNQILNSILLMNQEFLIYFISFFLLVSIGG